MKKSTLIKLGCLLGMFAGSAARAQVFNMQDINQGFANNGYNYMYYGQGAYPDTGNNTWNGFDNPNGPGSGDSFGGGNNNTDPLTATPGNPYANSAGAYWAPDNGAAATPVLFSPGNAGNTSAGNSYSDAKLSPVTVPQLVRGFDSGTALAASARTSPAWLFSEAAVVNTASPGIGTLPGFPLGLCVLSNVPAGTYDLYLYGANFDGTRGAAFVVSDTGTPFKGLYATMNPNAASGSGPLSSFGLGTNYVIYNNVTPDATGRISITWGAVSNIYSGLTGEGDFNGLQLVPSAPVLAPASIVQPPYNSSFAAGGTATLVADGRGNPAVAFQWYKVNSGAPPSPVSGQTSSTLAFTPFQGSQTGSYFVVVTNSGGSATSSVAALTLDTMPSVAAQSPAGGVTQAANRNLALSVTTSGATPLTYYWESNGIVVAITTNGPFLTNYNGSFIDFNATASSATVSNIAATCTLRCVVSNSFGLATNSPIVLTAVPLPTGAFPAAVLADNPVGYWLLDEASGTLAINYSTAGALLNGTYTPDPTSADPPGTLTQGVPGPAFLGGLLACQFSSDSAQSGGIGANVAIQDAPVLHLGIGANPVTMSAFIRVPSGSVNWFQTTVGKGDYSYRLDEERPQAGFNSDSSSDLVAGPALNDGLWHFWVGVWDGTYQYLYIDGALAGQNRPNPGNDHSTEFLAIGSAPDDTGRNFVGEICQVAIFGQALSDSQIVALYIAAGVPPAVTVQPASLFYDAGALATLGPVSASGSPPLSYQWYRGTPGSGTPLTNGNRFSGAASDTLVINPVAGSDQDQYYFIVSNGVATATSSVATLTVATTVRARVFAGRNPTFSVSAGDGAFTYQWSTNGVPVPGAASHTFTLGNVQAANNGETVSCAITDSSFVGAVDSSVETLTVVPAPTDPYAAAVLHDNPMAYFRLDEFNLSEDNGKGDDGTTVYDYISGNNGIYSNVVLNATGVPYGPPLTNTDGDATFGVFAPANSFAAFIPIDFSLARSNSPAQPGNAAFSVEAWIHGNAGQHNGGFVTKGYGLGSQNPSPGFFEQFSLQNSDLGTSGSRIEFYVTDAEGNESVAGTAAGTLNGNWHHVAGVCDQTNGQIYLYVDGLRITPNFGTGTITPGNGIMSTPVPVSIGAKQVADTSGNYNGQWVGDIDEVAIYNYALSPAQVAAHYWAAGIAPIFETAPLANVSADAGTTTNFTVVGFGTPPLSYQWSGPGGVIAGATNATLTLVDVNQSGTPPNTGPGNYTCVITNLYGTNSAVGVLTVPAGPPFVVQDLPADTFAVVGGTAVFAPGVQGSEPFTNSWQSNGIPLVNGGRISGATGTTLTIANVQLNDAADYQLFVTNIAGHSSSSVSTLIVENEPLFNTNGANWTANGTPPGNPSYVPSVNGNVLTITTAVNNEATSFFFDTPMYIGAFQAKFTYQDVTINGADGIAFCLQNDPRGLSALGGGGNDVGYSGISPSVALATELFAQIGSVGWNYVTNGAAPAFYISPAPVNLASGHPIDWTVTYNGSSITLTMFDETTSGAYTNTFSVGSFPAILGDDTAYIGFTGATGGYNALQNISNFSFVPIPILSAATSGKDVLITWPTGIGGYVLEQSSSLSAPNWKTVPGPYNIVDGRYQVEVSSPAGNEFFRLVLH
jgi:hypothetical protein